MKGLSVLENCSSRLLASSMLINGADNVKMRERGDNRPYARFVISRSVIAQFYPVGCSVILL